MIPYIFETRENYIKRMKEMHLDVARVHHRIGNNRSMWLALLYYAMSEDLYGEHWDDLQRRKK